MGKEILMFGNIEIEKKKKNYRHKIPIFLGDVDIKEVSVSRKIYSSEINYIYFVAYLYNHHKVKPFYIIFLKQALM